MHFFKVFFFGWVFLDGLFWVFLGGFFWVGFLFAHPGTRPTVYCLVILYMISVHKVLVHGQLYCLVILYMNSVHKVLVHCPLYFVLHDI